MLVGDHGGGGGGGGGAGGGGAAEECAMPAARLDGVAAAMAGEMAAGLAEEGGSKIKMIVSYVDNLPNG